MAGFLDRFRKEVVRSVWAEGDPKGDALQVDDKIALGVLLWVVAEADGEFLDAELDKIKETLTGACHLTADELAVVLSAVALAAKERIDLFTFTHEVSEDLGRPKKIEILEHLFRVACADQNLDESENSMIRKISGLFRLDHKEYIDAKLKVKSECGL
ncbi:TerB family tellurite resistance protein [Candidatus Omnitrophota bacterium]